MEKNTNLELFSAKRFVGTKIKFLSVISIQLVLGILLHLYILDVKADQIKDYPRIIENAIPIIAPMIIWLFPIIYLISMRKLYIEH